VTSCLQDRGDFNLIHPSRKLLLSWPGCACPWVSLCPLPLTCAQGPDLKTYFIPRCCQPPHPHRLYRACVQRTSLCSLLTGALLEATVSLGARPTLPFSLPQCSNGHAVLKGEWLYCNRMFGVLKVAKPL
ncbi:hypothetical protein GOODEAATRI_010356, partial [Goodea atripinnis]